MVRFFLLMVILLNTTFSFGQGNTRFEVVSGGSEIKDKETGLVWQRCNVGQKWDGTDCQGQSKELNIKEAISEKVEFSKLNPQYGWRVPSVSELASIIDCGDLYPLKINSVEGKEIFTCETSLNEYQQLRLKNNVITSKNPAIDLEAFPKTEGQYWSSTLYSKAEGISWVVDLTSGTVLILKFNSGKRAKVRFVRE